MPSAVLPTPRAGSDPPDDLDQLLDFDNAVEEFLHDIPVGNNDQSRPGQATEQPHDEDQEVQVKKKRKPVPKLDENLLLSQNGIPKLRRIAKTKMKFRGKGHEFSDVSRLLNVYQLWLDDLYPRAKFRDALTMVEKAGHSRRMQVMRRAWLDETKPHRRELSPDVEMSGADAPENDSLSATHDTRGLEEMPMSGKSALNVPGDLEVDRPIDMPDEDELDALLAESNTADQPVQKRKGPFLEDDSENEEPPNASTKAAITQRGADKHLSTNEASPEDTEEDELDALMAEQTSAPTARQATNDNVSSPQPVPNDNDFADDEEALASMGW